MATKTVYWITDKSLCCGDLPAPLIICTTLGRIIEGTLQATVIASASACDTQYRHTITYDSLSLNFEGAPTDLLTTDIGSVSCDGCYADYFRQLLNDALPGFDGWTVETDNWEYLAAGNQLTVPSGAMSRYSRGQKLDLLFNIAGVFSRRYYYIIDVTDTVITVVGDGDFPLVDSPIVERKTSRLISPLGFPEFFMYHPEYRGFSVPPAVDTPTFTIQGLQVFLAYAGGYGTSNATNFEIALPVAASITASSNYFGGMGVGTDAGAFVGDVLPSVSPLVDRYFLQLTRNGGASLWTASGNKNASFQISYHM